MPGKAVRTPAVPISCVGSILNAASEPFFGDCLLFGPLAPIMAAFREAAVGGSHTSPAAASFLLPSP